MGSHCTLTQAFTMCLFGSHCTSDSLNLSSMSHCATSSHKCTHTETAIFNCWSHCTPASSLWSKCSTVPYRNTHIHSWPHWVTVHPHASSNAISMLHGASLSHNARSRKLHCDLNAPRWLFESQCTLTQVPLQVQSPLCLMETNLHHNMIVTQRFPRNYCRSNREVLQACGYRTRYGYDNLSRSRQM